MQHPRGFPGLALALAILAPAAADERPGFEAHALPYLAQHCTGCHDAAKHKGDLVLDVYRDEAAAAKEPRVWQDVVARVEAGEMPPASRPRPAAAETAAFLRWARGMLQGEPNAPRDPGRVTLRRLNRAEYTSTVSDLLHLQGFQAAESFPTDGVGYGFDNIGDVLSLSTLLLEKYLDAAEAALEQGLGPVPIASRSIRLEAESMECTADDSVVQPGRRLLNSTSGVFSRVVCDDGTYLLRARAFGLPAKGVAPRMAFTSDDRELQAVEVKALEGEPQVYEARCRLAAGERRLGVAFTNDEADPKAPNPADRDRDLTVDWVEIEGPLDRGPTGNATSRQAVFCCEPTGAPRPGCAREILARFARRAYRRPVASDELDRLEALVTGALAGGESFEAAVRLALTAVLVSPHFLFRVELDPAPDDAARVRELTEHELASRLSYFLWGTMPDDELSRLADEGRLRASFREQVRRLLASPRSRFLVEGFAAQWLTLRNLDSFSPDRGRFPAFDDELRAAMRAETELTFTAVMREDRSLLEFLDADWTFLNERLAKHYGIAGVTGPEMRKVSVAGTVRGGLVTQASVLAVTSNPTRTSPVKRGRWILDQLLSAAPPDPPPDTPQLEAKDASPLTGTIRQQFEQHRADPSCSTCHARMDPLGFGLESFDAVGAWRTTDGGLPVDASGTLPDGRTFDGPAGLKRILRAGGDAFVRALAEKLLTFALGRGLEYHDRPALEAIALHVKESGYRFSSLVEAIAMSDPFQRRRGDTRRDDTGRGNTARGDTGRGDTGRGDQRQ